MSRVILLDTGPLGLVTHPRDHHGAGPWLARLLLQRAIVRIPEIADYELRRELLRARKTRSIDRLDGLKQTLGYLPLDTNTMLLAAELWARARHSGRPLADDAALDGDVILAAQAQTLAAGGHEVVIATTNTRHLATLVDARLWSDVS
jgi:predicted nucleic acid-binding protein